MSWIVLIIVGGIIGWLSSLIMSTDKEQGLIYNIIVGIVGSVVAKYLFGDVLGIGGASLAGTFSIIGILWGIAGAVVLIAILKAVKVL
jgi:uncharacterized membrane protein YeaQ/YmgE (transglycosylase-associated protein family)